MSNIENKDLTQDVAEIENTEETSVTPSAEDSPVADVLAEELNTTEEELNTSKDSNKDEADLNNSIDYLSPSIINVKEVTEIEMNEEDDLISDNEEFELYFKSFSDVREHEVVKGTVVGYNEREVLIDIGFKAEGIVYRSDYRDIPEMGKEVDVFITTFEDRHGNILLSKEKADFQRRWKEIKESFEKDEIITGLITRRIKGGMVVDLGIVQAFLPGSQIDIKPVVDFDEFVGAECEFKIVKFNELRQNVVLSRKAILATDLMEKRQEVLTQMEVGMVLEGIVKNITDFGAFIDLGGIDGLLHITDISWGRINHPSEKLTIGETVTVKVIDFDVEKVRVSLGMKQLSPEPWENVLTKYPEGSTINGKIVNMMNYGAFIEIEEGIEGLIHVSEMSWTKHIKHPSDLFKVGDDVEAKVLSIDSENKKISMGIKQLEDNPWDTIEAKYTVDSIHTGVVRNLTQFGAFIELEEGIDGLVHISDMSWTKGVRHPKELVNKGQELEVKILEVSSEERRLALGMKQLEEDPWNTLKNEFTSGKAMKGKVIRTLEKGIIFDLNNEIEGIVPMKQIPKSLRKKIKTEYLPDMEYDVTVQEVDGESKKVILMMDFGDIVEEVIEPNSEHENTETADKIEIPLEVLESLASVETTEEYSDLDSSEETDEKK